MSYQTSSKRWPPFWLLIGARTVMTVWNWSGKTLFPGALLAVLYFSSCHMFFRPFRLFLVPTICPWFSEDACEQELQQPELRCSLVLDFLTTGSSMSALTLETRERTKAGRPRQPRALWTKKNEQAKNLTVRL